MNISVLDTPLTISDIELEELEKRYLDYIATALRGDLKRIIDSLNYRFRIFNDERKQFTQIERMFRFFFNRIFERYASFPIEPDLTYKLDEAIIHIEIKINVVTNTDYKGKIQLGRNQVSYGTKRFKPNLPYFYESVKVPTLTYGIQIVHEHMRPKINALNVICIPNGKLAKYYGDEILQAGKGGWYKATDIRYKYSVNPYFLLLRERDKKDIFRIEILILDKKMSIKDITGKNLEILPYKRI